MGSQVPIVDYLVLDGGGAHLVARRCVACGAGYFDRRNACARCGGQEFERRDLPRSGSVRTFTIVHRAAPTVETPYVSAVVELTDGTRVKSNLVGVDPSPDAISLGMPVGLTTYVAGVDDDGTEAIAFGFEPSGSDPAAEGSIDGT